MGGWVCLGFPRFWEKCMYPPLGGGWSALLAGWVLLSLVDRQHCSWAEAHCDTWECCHFVQPCFASCFCNGHHFHFSLYMVLKRGMAGTCDPVVITQVSQRKPVTSNPPVHSFTSF